MVVKGSSQKEWKPTTRVTLEPEGRKLPRRAIIRSSRDFERIRHSGRIARGRFVTAAVCVVDQPQQARVAVVTSKKVGKAVVRSKVRRRLREVLRYLRPHLVAGCELICWAKPPAASANFSDLREECLLLARKLSILRA